MMQILLVAFEVLWIACFSFPKPLTVSDIVPPGYDKLLPPKVIKGDKSLPVNVTLRMYVLQLRSFDEVEMDFKMDIIIREQWKDDRLIFPEEIAGNRSKIVLDPLWRNDIWTPDIWFKNALDITLQKWVTRSVLYWIERDKTLHFAGRVTLELSCDMRMEKYPHDSQFCGISIISLMDPSTDLQLNWNESQPVRISSILTLPQFEVGNISRGRCDTDMYEETYSCVNVNFVRIGYFIINTYIPTVLIVFMSMLIFWIPPESAPARVSLGVTSLLTIITKQYQSTMPTVSYIVALNIWLSSCVAFVFCSLLEYALVLTLLKKRQNEVKSIPDIQTEGYAQKEITNISSEGKSGKSAWIHRHCRKIQRSPHLIDTVSKFVFPIAFIVFCIAYANLYVT
ncbi:Glycine receptor subunit alpha-2, partial [Stegodyphus mimosarum]